MRRGRGVVRACCCCEVRGKKKGGAGGKKGEGKEYWFTHLRSKGENKEERSKTQNKTKKNVFLSYFFSTVILRIIL